MEVAGRGGVRRRKSDTPQAMLWNRHLITSALVSSLIPLVTHARSQAASPAEAGLEPDPRPLAGRREGPQQNVVGWGQH